MSTGTPARRRIPAVALALAMAGPLAACGANDPKGTDAPEASSTNAATPLEVAVTKDPDTPSSPASR